MADDNTAFIIVILFAFIVFAFLVVNVGLCVPALAVAHRTPRARSSFPRRTGKVLKDRRPHRQRGRIGTSVRSRHRNDDRSTHLPVSPSQVLLREEGFPPEAAEEGRREEEEARGDEAREPASVVSHRVTSLILQYVIMPPGGRAAVVHASSSLFRADTSRSASERQNVRTATSRRAP